jgi:hypothetical protein
VPPTELPIVEPVVLPRVAPPVAANVPPDTNHVEFEELAPPLVATMPDVPPVLAVTESLAEQALRITVSANATRKVERGSFLLGMGGL